MTLVGWDMAPLRVLILAGQHGDEGWGRAAVESFPDALRNRETVPPHVCLALVPNLNPDGATRHTRRNARGIDLNRDHQLLVSAETRALHCFVRAWRPHLIVDVHTYPPRRKRLLLHNLVHCHDVFLDAPTNPSLRLPALDAETPGFLSSIVEELNARGYRSGRYVLVTASGRVRHSTPDVIDARNGLALRYGIPTLLIEGREPVRNDILADRARLLVAVQAAIDRVVRWAEENQESLTVPPPPLETAAWVAVRSRYLRADGPCTMPFQDARSGAIQQAEVPGVFCPRLKVTKRVRLPGAYAVPRTHQALIEVLHRHGFPNQPVGPGTIGTVERYRIRDRVCSSRPGHPPRRLSVDAMREQQALADYVFFPVTPDGGHALAVYLEPESKYGLHRFAGMKLTLGPDSFYPVLRVLSHTGPGI